MNILVKIYNRSYKLWTPFRMLKNIILTWRYPWLGIYNYRTNKMDKRAVWASPHDGGWNRAFFFPMMERIRRTAKKDGVLHTLRTDDFKSKYGGLRFYTSGGSKNVQEIISEYECLSEYICESCGEPDVGSTSGWITPICRKCYAKLCNDTRSYDECVGEGRMPDFRKFRRCAPNEEWEECIVDIRDKANEIRRKWNFWHPTRRKKYAEY